VSAKGALALAQQCLRSVVRAVTSRDLTALAAGNFSNLMRRGLERLVEQTPAEFGLGEADVDWDSFRLESRKTYSDLIAHLYRFSADSKPMIQLTGVDPTRTVCDFAFLEDISRTDLPYLKDRGGLHRSPWFSTSLFSTNFKLDALLPGHAGLNYTTRKLGDVMTATVKVPVGYFETLSERGSQKLLDDLSTILRNGARLTYDTILPSAMHIIVIESSDERGRTLSYIGGPPKELWLADRVVEVSG